MCLCDILRLCQQNCRGFLSLAHTFIIFKIICLRNEPMTFYAADKSDYFALPGVVSSL